METIKHMTRSSTLVALFLVATAVDAGTTQLATSPMSGASSVAISPNILFVLDDSDSMDWPFLPDWAGDKDGARSFPLYQQRNARFNGIAYNPAITYTPPKYFQADGSADTTSFPSQTSDITDDWRVVKNDGYNVQSDTAISLIGNAYYYTTVPGEYCSNRSMKTCVAASAKSAEYPYPAYLRWCKSAAAAAAKNPASGECQATEIDPAGDNTAFNFPRMPAPRASTISIGGTDSTSITKITVHDEVILSAPTVASILPETVAKNVAASINACTFAKAGACTIAGYSAVAAGKTVVISAPGIPAAEEKPAISASGEMTITTTVFDRPSTNQAPGENLLTVITPSTVFPVKDTRRSDCQADTCTYAEEMTNYANWWAYYHTRMQTMKTASSLSFQPISKSYRVGYMTINNNQFTDFLNLDSFDAAHKKAWYDKLFKAAPGKQTPLRVALSNAGRLYGGRLTELNGVTVEDPVQFYCQQNVTILSTDGYWNNGLEGQFDAATPVQGFQLDGTTPVGDQDGPGLEVRPQLDGGGPKEQETKTWTEKTVEPTLEQAHLTIVQSQSQEKRVPMRTRTQQTQTAQLQMREKTQWQSQTWQLESNTRSQLQSRTKTQPQIRTTGVQAKIDTLQARTLTLHKQTKKQDQEQTSQLQMDTVQGQSYPRQLQQNLTQVQQQTSSDGGTRWTDWSNVDKCTPRAGAVRCAQLKESGWKDVASCTVVEGGVTGSGGEDTKTYTTDSRCQYRAGRWVNSDTCQAVAKPRGPTYTLSIWVEGCRSIWPETWVNVSSCKAVTDVTRCRYTDWSPLRAVDDCQETPQSKGPEYTVGLARVCTRNGWSSAVATSECVEKAGSVKCSYEDPTDWFDDADCEESYSTKSPYTLLTKKECRIDRSWRAVESCEVGVGKAKTECRYLEPSDWSDTASCTEVLPAKGVYARKVECQNVWTPFTDTATCIPEKDKTECQTVGAAFRATDSCRVVSGKTWCQYSLKSDWVNVAACPELKRSTGPTDYTVGIATECRKDWTAWVDVASCNASDGVRECRYDNWSDPTDRPSCTKRDPSVGPTSYTVGLATKCGDPVWTPWVDQSSCTPIDGTECGEPKWTDLADWVSTTPCAPTDSRRCIPRTVQDADVDACDKGETTVAGRTSSCTYRKLPTVTTHVPPTEECVEAEPDEKNGFKRTRCFPKSDGPNDVAAGANCKPSEASKDNNWVTTKCSSAGTLGPTSDTLADVAEYYWKTDLRDSSRCESGESKIDEPNVCKNDDKAEFPWQKMNTYTLGLGASGLMQYDRDYQSAKSPDFNSIESGEDADPGTGTCSWQSTGECNWPKPASNSQTNIDDLWHAAVNGRGTYFSATDPSSLATGLSDALKNVGIKAGALSAVTVTSPNLVSGGENSLFEVSFTAGDWAGEVVKRSVNASTGELSTPVWEAQALLDAKVAKGTHTARTIYTYDAAAASDDKLRPFLYAELSDAEKEYFKRPAIDTLSHFCLVGTICLTSETKDKAQGEPLFNFVRGDQSHEGSEDDLSSYYRRRAHLLGDIVGSEAVYVQGSPWNYADLQYSAFKTTNKTRAGRVYVAANDGMLHAFDAATGEEAWAYVPAIVMPRLYQLADKKYAVPNGHQFLVDGTPVAGDIYDKDSEVKSWKTILVGGLNNGGRGYYALDITDPAAPKGLWEFTNDNLGYTYGNPVITKLKDGTWVVIVASGYNNVAPGDGKGRLFILDAASGTVIRTISTDVGDTDTPSGLARIAGWANFPDNNNTTQRVYGGDQLGNLWRFDVNGDIGVIADPPVYDAQRLATLVDAGGNAQPVTGKPELGKVGSYPVVFVGTGQLLGSDDLVTTQQQSLYAIKDRLTDSDYGSPRALGGSFVEQTLTSATCPKDNIYCTEGQAILTSSDKAVDFHTNDGWYIDFPVAGERVNTDLRLQLSTLAFNTNTPTSGACVPVGVSFAYFLDYRTGGAVDGTDGLVGIKLGDYLSTSPSVIRLEDGTIKALIRTDSPDTISAPVPTAPTPLDTRRVSWRELITE